VLRLMLMKSKTTAARQACFSTRQRSRSFPKTQKLGDLVSSASRTGGHQRLCILSVSPRHVCCSGRSIAIPASHIQGRDVQVISRVFSHSRDAA